MSINEVELEIDRGQCVPTKPINRKKLYDAYDRIAELEAERDLWIERAETMRNMDWDFPDNDDYSEMRMWFDEHGKALKEVDGG